MCLLPLSEMCAVFSSVLLFRLSLQTNYYVHKSQSGLFRLITFDDEKARPVGAKKNIAAESYSKYVLEIVIQHGHSLDFSKLV